MQLISQAHSILAFVSFLFDNFNSVKAYHYLLLAVVLIARPVHSYAEEVCVICHGNALMMQAAGYPQFTVTAADILSQTHMPATCTDCHLGDGKAANKEDAHKGILVVKAVKDRTVKAVPRSAMGPGDMKEWPDLEARGNNRATLFLPKSSVNGRLVDNPDYRLIIWHDKNPETLAFNPGIAEETCGKCHADIVKDFLKSPMGGGTGAHTQSQYKAWTGPTGPQSCGLWVGSLSKPDQDSFNDENMKHYNRHSTMPMNEKSAYNSQKKCNQCHVGCLDCHYKPPHTFLRKPAPLSCYGGGKSFSCHAGPLERRRGDGYFRAEFTQSTPQGTKILNNVADVHMQKGVTCTDCHEPNRKSGFHADVKRDVNCEKCHAEVVRANEMGAHKHVDCASCHTALVGGYAFNFWSAVGPKGNENPLTRIQDYLVEAMSPIIIKNPMGVWVPVHVLPHTSGNVKAGEVRLSDRLLFRNRPDSDIDRLYFSNDSYAITGLVRNLDDKDHDTMVWLNLDKVAHGTGKARGCESCHASTAQKIRVKFSGGSYKDVEDGEYTIIADGKGLRVVDFRAAGEGTAPKGLGAFKDKWDLAGDFALPALKDKKIYDRMRKKYEEGKFAH